MYVYERSGNTWTQQQQLFASDGIANEAFGSSVALDGERALIGAGNADIDANVGQGAAYVFAYDGSNWIEQSKLIASDGAASDRFGEDVALDADTALVGANFDDVGTNADQG